MYFYFAYFRYCIRSVFSTQVVYKRELHISCIFNAFISQNLYCSVYYLCIIPDKYLLVSDNRPTIMRAWSIDAVGEK